MSKAAARAGGSRALLSAAVSSDGHYLAVGGGDRKVHVWDARSRQYIQVPHVLRCSLICFAAPFTCAGFRSVCDALRVRALLARRVGRALLACQVTRLQVHNAWEACWKESYTQCPLGLHAIMWSMAPA